MKLLPTKVTLADGSKLINGYKVTLSKVECEKYGFKGGDELKAEFSKNEIKLKKESWYLKYQLL